MNTENRRTFVRKSLATTLSFSFSGLIRAHGEESGESTTWIPDETTFESIESGGTTTWNPNETTYVTTLGEATTWNPDETTEVTTDTTTVQTTKVTEFEVAADPNGTSYEPIPSPGQNGYKTGDGAMCKLKISGSSGDTGTVKIECESWDINAYSSVVWTTLGEISMSCDTSTGAKTGSTKSPNPPGVFTKYTRRKGTTVTTDPDGTTSEEVHRMVGNIEITEGNPMTIKVTLTGCAAGQLITYSHTSQAWLATHEDQEFFSYAGSASGMEGLGLLQPAVVAIGTLKIQEKP